MTGPESTKRSQNQKELIDSHGFLRICEDACRQAGVRFDDVCIMAGISESTLWRWMRGERWPNVATIRKINQSYKDVLKKEEKY